MFPTLSSRSPKRVPNSAPFSCHSSRPTKTNSSSEQTHFPELRTTLERVLEHAPSRQARGRGSPRQAHAQLSLQHAAQGRSLCTPPQPLRTAPRPSCVARARRAPAHVLSGGAAPPFCTRNPGRGAGPRALRAAAVRQRVSAQAERRRWGFIG